MSGWEALRPEDAVKVLDAFEGPWWIAGGWALDLFAGRALRPHEDLDVMVLRRDAERLPAALPGWELEDKGSSLWSRPREAERWHLEFVLDDADGDTWRYRRDARVTRPLGSLGAPRGPLAPEVVLLYKAKDDGEKARFDFAGVVPLLPPDARAWLRGAVELAHPDSPHLAAL
ncbi:MAG TPA: hypothetical protein VEG24_06825 [Gaiellaceae bacterium]|nr:hypothetical protein [Gaiellaceae bacterium]